MGERDSHWTTFLVRNVLDSGVGYVDTFIRLTLLNAKYTATMFFPDHSSVSLTCSIHFSSFENAKEVLSNTKTLAPCYYILGGNSSGQVRIAILINNAFTLGNIIYVFYYYYYYHHVQISIAKTQSSFSNYFNFTIKIYMYILYS